MTGKERLTANGFSLLAGALALLALGACGSPAPPTTAEDERIEQAMERMKAEQDRTDLAQIRAQAEAAGRHRERLDQPWQIATQHARPIRPVEPREPLLADTARSQPPSSRTLADAPDTVN